MTIRNWQRGPAVAAVVGLVAVAATSCGDSAESAPASLGLACIPGDEYAPGFSGYDEDEINVESNNPACGESAVCLLNHFRGRVTCPYGQPPDDIDTLPGDDEPRCVTPGSSSEAVTVPVRPQLEDRRPEDTVYCSCRCADAAGNTDGSDLCQCPSGFSCEHLVDDLGLGRADIAGSYCLKQGTAFDQTAPLGRSCSDAEMNCGDARPLLDVPDPEIGGDSINQFLEQLTTDAAGASCLPRALPVNSDGSSACVLVEVTDPSFGIDCGAPGRAPLTGVLADLVREATERSGRCGDDSGQSSCADLTICQLTEAQGGNLQECQETPDTALPDGVYAGYCYIDAMLNLDADPATQCEVPGDPDCLGNPELVADCDPNQRRRVRFVSSGVEPQVPAPNSTVFVACQGSPWT